ncbi:PIN-like domain-containing protein [Streptacidiphilus sp. N1-3]|uniref:PIN-like domain-containing protein n=1 Tax=Streptacidiphilus alkalitolerans TaxID=3342712 RepID=A0ABV6WWX9_9ACTN
MGEPALVRQYKAWLQPGALTGDSNREGFFTRGLVVLDTNVLLSLYEYTSPAREQVLTALERIPDRLWLPHQVGLEFVRGRHRVLENRRSTLRQAPNDVRNKLIAARKSVLDASDSVKRLLVKYAQDTEASAKLDEAFNPSSVDGYLAPWLEALLKPLEKLTSEHDLAPGSVDADDPVLPRIAALYGERVGRQPSAEVLRDRIEYATAFRFPNRIPPGFGDAGKGTPLEAAGDFLLWEEVVQEARLLADPQRYVLFVSADTVKGDWYEPAEPGRGPRPWPMLFDELENRAGAQLRIETPTRFFQGINEYLHADITEATYEEIERAAETLDRPALKADSVPEVTEDTAAQLAPPHGLALDAYHSVGLSSAAVRSAVESPKQAHWTFQWWLIGVTFQLGRRDPVDGEPSVAIKAAIRSSVPPAPHWKPGTVLRSGEWLHRESSWVAPWFIYLLNSTSQVDSVVLQRLAVQQADREAQRDH